MRFRYKMLAAAAVMAAGLTAATASPAYASHGNSMIMNTANRECLQVDGGSLIMAECNSTNPWQRFNVDGTGGVSAYIYTTYEINGQTACIGASVHPYISIDGCAYFTWKAGTYGDMFSSPSYGCLNEKDNDPVMSLACDANSTYDNWLEFT